MPVPKGVPAVAAADCGRPPCATLRSRAAPRVLRLGSVGSLMAVNLRLLLPDRVDTVGMSAVIWSRAHELISVVLFKGQRQRGKAGLAGVVPDEA